MTSHRLDTAAHLPHAEIAAPGDLVADCRSTQRNLGLTTQPPSLQGPSLLFADFPTDLPKREINVSEAAARLATVYYAD